MYTIYSTAYLEQEVNSYCCYMNQKLWEKIMKNSTSRMFARIMNDDKYWVCSVGNPIRTDFDDKTVFVPTWMLEQIGCNGDGELLPIEWFPADTFDHSTKIVLKPFDRAFEVGDIQKQLSYELTKLGILQKNTNILIQMPELDGYEIMFNVKDVEPASVVLCQGDDVELEFDYSLIEEPVVSRPPSPYPFEALPTILYPEAEGETLPETHQVLGGIKREERFNPWRNKDFKPNTT